MRKFIMDKYNLIAFAKAELEVVLAEAKFIVEVHIKTVISNKIYFFIITLLIFITNFS